MRQQQRSTSTLLIAPQATTGGSSVTANLDTASLGANTNAKALELEIDVALGTGVNTNAVNGTIKLLEADTTDVSNFATIVANQAVVVGTAAAAAGVLAYFIDMRGRKRWLRVSVTDGTATNDQFSFAVLAKTLASQEPASTSDLATTAVIV